MSPVNPESSIGRCAECASPLAPDQRYCLHCGARRGALPMSVAVALGELESTSAAGAGPLAAADPSAGGGEPTDPETLAPRAAEGDSDLESDAADGEDREDRLRDIIPAARGAAVSLLLAIAFGAIIGAATAPGGVAALASTLVVAVSPPAPTATPVASTEGSGFGGGGSGPDGGGSGGGGSGGSAAPAAAAAPLTARTVTLPYSGSSGGGRRRRRWWLRRNPHHRGNPAADRPHLGHRAVRPGL